MKFIAIPSKKLTKDDELEMAKLLIKAGYRTWIDDLEIKEQKIHAICYDAKPNYKKSGEENETK